MHETRVNIGETSNLHVGFTLILLPSRGADGRLRTRGSGGGTYGSKTRTVGKRTLGALTIVSCVLKNAWKRNAYRERSYFTSCKPKVLSVT
jgi:hypothetical protein